MGRPTIIDPADTVPGQRILSALSRYRYLTIRQLNRLLGYSRDSKLLHKYVKRLADAGVISTANVLPKNGYEPGGSEYVVCLAGRTTKRSGIFLSEQHVINDCLIALDNFGDEGACDLVGFLHEQELKSLIRTGAVPDGYVAYHLPNGNKLGFALEVDLGTEAYTDPYQATNWQKKITQLVEFAQGPYREVFPYESLTVAVVVRPRRGSAETRLKNLLTWTEELLAGQEDWGDFFRFTTANPVAMSPQAFVGDSHWVVPFTYQEIPLVAL